jgi:hypothetical protein
MSQDEIDLHILEYGVEMDGHLYLDGCPDAEFDECAICREIDRQETES